MLGMKKTITIVTALVCIGLMTGVATLNAPKAGEADTSPLIQQVQSNTNELANHEARITATETNVASLQAKTDTPTATQTNTPQTEQSSIQPAPVTVVSYQQIPQDDQGNIDCQFTYSDGTTYQWHWQTVDPQGSKTTDAQTGHVSYSAVTFNQGSCDGSYVGSVKN